jgi:hypothetical protein
MNIKILSLTIASLVLSMKLNGQLNLPLLFKEDVIKWSELSWIEGQNEKDQLLFMASPPVTIGDTIFTFMNYYQKELESGKNYGYCGYSIKKINKTSGAKYWETKRYYKEYGERKILSNPIIEKGKISVSLYDEVRATGYGTDWYECYPAHIVIDRTNGNIIDSNYVDKSNTELPKMRSFGDLYLAGPTRPQIYLKDNAYLHRRVWIDEFTDTHLNFNGELKRVDSTKYPIHKYYRDNLSFYLANNDTFHLFIIAKTQNWASTEFLFSKYDKNMNLVKTYDISEHFQEMKNSAAVNFIDNGYFVAGTTYYDPEAKTLKYTNYLFTSEAQLIDKASYTLRPGVDDIIRYGWLWPIVDIENKRLLFTQSRQDKLSESTYFELYVTEGDSLTTLKSIEVEGIKDHFRIMHATMMSNGDILMYIQQFTDPTATGQRWYSWMMLDGQKMNIISSTKNQVNVNRLSIYPNPTSDKVYIEGTDEAVKVSIINPAGYLIKQTISIENQIDITDLPNGVYIFEITSNKFKESHKIIKIE